MTVIKKLEIASFGKFKDYTLNLKPGLNEFVCENEFGKSTITDFILFILYGFAKTTSKKAELEENLLKKYLPWNSEPVLAGALEADCDGKLFRIERMQNDGRKKSVTVRDATGTALDIDGSPGKMLFGVDRQTFERTFLIRQTDIKFSGTGGLELALKNLVTTGDEDTSYEAAAQILYRKNIKYRHIDRQSGRIFDLKKQIAQLTLDTAQKRRQAEESSDINGRLAELCRKRSELEDREQRLNEMLPLAKNADARRRLESYRQTQSQIDSIDQSIEQFKKTGLTLQAVNQITNASAELKLDTDREKSAKQRADAAESDFSRAKADFSKFENIRQNEREILVLFSKKPRPNAAFCSAGVIAAAVAAALIITSRLTAGIIVMLLGAAAIAAGMIFKSKIKIPSAYAASMSELKEKYEQFKYSEMLLQQLKSEYDTAAADYERCKNKLKDSLLIYNELDKKYGIEAAGGPQALTDLLAHQAMLESKIEQLKDSQRQNLQNDTPDQLEAMAKTGDCEYSETQLQNMLIKIKDDKAALSDEISVLKRQQSMTDDLKKSVYESEQKIKELEYELSCAEYSDSVLTIAREALCEAYEYISSKFAPMLTECARQPLSEITDGKYDSIALDRQFNLRVKYRGIMYDLGYFSRGTADAVYFAVRIAVCQLISDKSGLPLIMDDPFWSFDDKRLQSARKVTEKISHNNQIIIFSARK